MSIVFNDQGIISSTYSESTMEFTFKYKTTSTKELLEFDPSDYPTPTIPGEE